MDKLRFEIDLQGKNLTCQDTITRAIGRKLMAEKMNFNELFARLVNQLCPRAAVDMESFAVTDASYKNNKGGYVNVGVNYNAYYGFEDISKSRDIMEKWRFTIDGDKAIFNLLMPTLHVAHEL